MDFEDALQYWDQSSESYGLGVLCIAIILPFFCLKHLGFFELCIFEYENTDNWSHFNRMGLFNVFRKQLLWQQFIYLFIFSLVHMHFQYFLVFYSPNFNVKLIKLLCN